MTLYSIVLFVHIAAALSLFAALSIEVLSLFRLQRVSSLTEARQWIEPVPLLPWMTGGSGLVIFISGVYLAMRMQAFELAWLKVAILALLPMAPLGALTGRSLRAMRHACMRAEAVNSQLLRQLRDPFLKVSLGIRLALFLGIVLLMVAKPELWESISIVAGAAVVGLLSALLVGRRGEVLAAPSTYSGS